MLIYSLHLLVAGQGQPGSQASVSTDITLVIVFGILGPLVAILVAVCTVWYEHRRRQEPDQGMFPCDQFLSSSISCKRSYPGRDAEPV